MDFMLTTEYMSPSMMKANGSSKKKDATVISENRLMLSKSN